MSEIEKMKRYIERTPTEKHDRYCLLYPKASELYHLGLDANYGLLEAISMAFNYGKAKGYRAAKAEVRG